MTQNASRDQNTQSTVTKEIIKEKEVVTRVRCPYCHGAYNETLDTCPHCGAKNKETNDHIIRNYLKYYCQISVIELAG
jgi:DnaJ-class molecular chaperone